MEYQAQVAIDPQMSPVATQILLEFLMQYWLSILTVPMEQKIIHTKGFTCDF